MKTLLEMANILEENILKLYKEVGEEEVNLSLEYKSSSVTIGIIYPKHIDSIFTGILPLINKLKFENNITEYNLSISSLKLKVSLFK